MQRPRPPLILSALGPKSLAFTAQIADGWVSFGGPAAHDAASTFDAVAQQAKLLERELERHQRDASSFHRVILDFAGDHKPLASFESFVDWAGRYRELGFGEVVVHWPAPDSPYECDPALFERIATEGARLLAAL